VRVLLTGASGFIGSAIHDLLREEGHEVVAVDALIPQAHGADVVPAEGVHPLDVREADEWVDLLRGVDVVCHQSAMVGAGVTVADMPLYASHNDYGTAVLLAAMGEAGVPRLVFASSMVVYGEGRYRCPEHGPVVPGVRSVADLEAGRFDNPCTRCGAALGWELVDEDARLDPRSSYAASKLATEHYAAAWVRQAGGRAVGLRYHNVYGARMPRDTPYSGVAAIFRSSLERGESPRVFEDGGQMRDFVHVSDVARANLASLEAVMTDELAPYQAFNVCSGEPVSISDVARMLGAASGIEPTVTGEYRLGDVRHVVASPERARQRLGFTARVGPEQGLAAFVHEPLRT
jgi:dTDP-L-rhamnose 4-epimerase